MRKQFIQTDSRKAAAEACPWACKIARADGGYWCFESISDYRTWRGQA